VSCIRAFFYSILPVTKLTQPQQIHNTTLLYIKDIEVHDYKYQGEITMKKMMKGAIALLGLSLCGMLVSKPAHAVQLAAVNQNSDVTWSKTVQDVFDGTIVYDKHFTDNFAFVTSWTKGGIHATHTTYSTEMRGYRTVWQEQGRWDRGQYVIERYPIQQPIYERVAFDRPVKTLMFAISGQIYAYEDGRVDPNLAAALANAPAGSMNIRAVFRNGETQDLPIGSGTVEAWKTIFRAH
jgi:hypothetical protein